MRRKLDYRWSEAQDDTLTAWRSEAFPLSNMDTCQPIAWWCSIAIVRSMLSTAAFQSLIIVIPELDLSKFLSVVNTNPIEVLVLREVKLFRRTRSSRP